MAVTAGQGHSRVIEKRRWDDYPSLKQYYKNSLTDEVIISGSTTSDGGAAEISFCDNVLNYIAAEGQIYIRCEADDANQHSKYVYVEYQNDDGVIDTVVTGDLNAADSTTEVILTGADDFYRLRQMYSEVESASGGGKSILLCDADWDGIADTYGEIKDGNTAFALERFFTQPSATATSYLGRVEAWAPIQDGDSAAAGFMIEINYTPAVVNLGEAQTAADITVHFDFSEHFKWEPCIELAPATEVKFYVGDYDTAGVIHIEATMLEVYK